MRIESPVLERRKTTPSQESKATTAITNAPEVPKGANIAQRMKIFELEFTEMASMTTSDRESSPGSTNANCSTC